MKKKIFIGTSVLVFVLGISLFLIFGRSKDNKIELKDYSYVNVEEIKSKDFVALVDDIDIVKVKNVRIVDGYLEGVILINSDKNYDNLNVKVNLYDKNGNLLDSINFNLENVVSYEERDLFYPIQKDLSNAYYVDIEEVKN